MPVSSGLPEVVIGHDFAETYGGAERVTAQIAATFPDAPVVAIAGRPEVAARMGVADRLTTMLPSRERILEHYRLLAPALPTAVARREVPACDVLLTSSYGFSHHMRAANGARQLCWCVSPLRFAWSMQDEYAERWSGWAAAPGRRAFGAMAAWMRREDLRAAARVDSYLAVSEHVAAQVREFYGREAQVLHPPVDCELFRPPTEPGHDGYFLFCGRLVEPYKRPGAVVEAFRGLDAELVVAGDGPAYAELSAAAPPNVRFLGRVGDDELIPLMQRCAAVIFPSVDDFGLIPVETMACGRPVIAYAGGGALETVVEGETGVLIREQTATAVRAAVEAFDPDAWDPARICEHALGWEAPRFRERLRELVGEVAARG